MTNRYAGEGNVSFDGGSDQKEAVDAGLPSAGASKKEFGKPVDRINVQIAVGEMAFEFSSKADWVANAQKRFHRYRMEHETMDDPMPSTICIDARGRVVTRGLGFMRAEKDGSYPIKVYPIHECDERTDDPNAGSETGTSEKTATPLAPTSNQTASLPPITETNSEDTNHV